jgi:DNA replication and repair protein RecF
VLKQRTALLKSARARGIRGDELTTLDVWDDKLVQLGTQVIRARLALATDLAGPLATAYTTIAGEDHRPELEWALTIDGATSDDDELSERDAAGSAAPTDAAGASGGAAESARSADEVEAAFRAVLSAKRASELERGVTLVGPHRDDLLLRVRGLPVKGYASHGESWSVALSLRLASAQLLREQSMLGDPVLILDDVFAELDADRRARLAGVVGDFEQVIVTAAVEGDVPEQLRTRTVYVEAGTIREPDDV